MGRQNWDFTPNILGGSGFFKIPKSRVWVVLDELRCILNSNLLNQCSTISQGPNLKINDIIFAGMFWILKIKMETKESKRLPIECIFLTIKKKICIILGTKLRRKEIPMLINYLENTQNTQIKPIPSNQVTLGSHEQ
jgi:hypothetical protein